jgi:mRNA-degrading endonuclease RelE of RelBE toxin-antitoxin system
MITSAAATQDDVKTPWTVSFNSRAKKQKEKLPVNIQAKLLVLVTELRMEGPVQREWKHFGKLEGSSKKEVYHCHLNSGRPTYVVIWEVKDRTARIMNIVYDGTHEKADYKHFAG